ncbi:MAG: nucleotide exchange factor GrpE [Erysipelotrichaceae bacterium]|nr:nucleotide exchange factor GrpE [Erysipelotrichaceae bacterium]MDD3809604.1 nucleotide exchange factor GrpE [Erysipelotrichaceae bacterium]
MAQNDNLNEEEIQEEATQPEEEVLVADETDKIGELENEVAKWKNEYYKVFADMENVKRRLQNEHSNSMKFMMQRFIEELLPVIDSFERSLAVENPGEEIAVFLKGYSMIYTQLKNILEKEGVEVIETKDQEFDPNVHQAVMSQEVEGIAPGMVIEELQKGYKLKDRVIRASLVKVSA